jgi:hypothetical protein
MSDIQKAAENYATTYLGGEMNDEMYYGFLAGAQWERSRHEWVKCSDRLPTEADGIKSTEDGEPNVVDYMWWSRWSARWFIEKKDIQLVKSPEAYWRTPLPNNFPEPPKTRNHDQQINP